MDRARIVKAAYGTPILGSRHCSVRLRPYDAYDNRPCDDRDQVPSRHLAPRTIKGKES